jgi:electron transport complex protein RnfG
MRDFIKLPLILFIVALIAGALLGVTNALTKEPIERQNELALKKAREDLFEDSEFAEITEHAVFDEYENLQKVYEAKKDGKVIGYIITLTVKGYGGDILLNVGVTTEGNSTGVIVGTNSETPGLGAKASEEEFSSQFAGKKDIVLVKGEATAENEVSAITAATITSQAVTDGANQAAEISSKIMGGSK